MITQKWVILFLPALSVGLYFCPQTKDRWLRVKKQKKLYQIVLEFPNTITKRVPVKASSREVAEKRALKFNPNAIGVKRDA